MRGRKEDDKERAISTTDEGEGKGDNPKEGRNHRQDSKSSHSVESHQDRHTHSRKERDRSRHQEPLDRRGKRKSSDTDFTYAESRQPVKRSKDNAPVRGPFVCEEDIIKIINQPVATGKLISDLKELNSPFNLPMLARLFSKLADMRPPEELVKLALQFLNESHFSNIDLHRCWENRKIGKKRSISFLLKGLGKLAEEKRLGDVKNISAEGINHLLYLFDFLSKEGDENFPMEYSCESTDLCMPLTNFPKVVAWLGESLSHEVKKQIKVAMLANCRVLIKVTRLESMDEGKNLCNVLFSLAKSAEMNLFNSAEDHEEVHLALVLMLSRLGRMGINSMGLSMIILGLKKLIAAGFIVDLPFERKQVFADCIARIFRRAREQGLQNDERRMQIRRALNVIIDGLIVLDSSRLMVGLNKEADEDIKQVLVGLIEKCGIEEKNIEFIIKVLQDIEVTNKSGIFERLQLQAKEKNTIENAVMSLLQTLSSTKQFSNKTTLALVTVIKLAASDYPLVRARVGDGQEYKLDSLGAIFEKLLKHKKSLDAERISSAISCFASMGEYGLFSAIKRETLVSIIDSIIGLFLALPLPKKWIDMKSTERTVEGIAKLAQMPLFKRQLRKSSEKIQEKVEVLFTGLLSLNQEQSESFNLKMSIFFANLGMLSSLKVLQDFPVDVFNNFCLLFNRLMRNKGLSNLVILNALYGFTHLANPSNLEKAKANRQCAGNLQKANDNIHYCMEQLESRAIEGANANQIANLLPSLKKLTDYGFNVLPSVKLLENSFVILASILMRRQNNALIDGVEWIDRLKCVDFKAWSNFARKIKQEDAFFHRPLVIGACKNLMNHLLRKNLPPSKLVDVLIFLMTNAHNEKFYKNTSTYFYKFIDQLPSKHISEEQWENLQEQLVRLLKNLSLTLTKQEWANLKTFANSIPSHLMQLELVALFWEQELFVHGVTKVVPQKRKAELFYEDGMDMEEKTNCPSLRPNIRGVRAAVDNQ